MRAHEFLPPKPRRQRRAMRWHFGKTDIVSIHGIPCVCVKNDEAGYVFARIDDLTITFKLSRDEFEDVRDLQSFRFERDGMDPDKALAALQAPVRSLMDLPADERHYVQWKVRACEKFLCMQARGLVSKYKPSLKAALKTIQRELDEEGRKAARNGKRPRGGWHRHDRPGSYPMVGPDQFRKNWLKRYFTKGPLGLCDRYHNCGNHDPYYNPEEYEVLLKYVWKYLSPERPSIAELWRDMDEEFGATNAERRRAGLPDLRVPDDDLLRIEIGRLPKFDVVAARHGEEFARNMFRPVVGGVPDLVRPMQRVEADDWLTHLHVLATEVKLWEWISPDLREKAKPVRATLSAAICCTTRCLPAVTLSLGGNSSNTRMLLRMCLTDKSSIAQFVGCETPWEYGALMNLFVVDEGTPFVNDDSQAICTDLRIAFKSPQAETPRQRGKIERWFQTMDIRGIARFAGRAFSNPVMRGKYEALARACVTVEELAALIVRFIVDVYHNSPHAGLGGETPRACWLRLSKRKPPTVPPGRDQIRRAFGQDFTATVQSSGIEIFGNWYQSREAQQVFETQGNVEVIVRVDSEDLGAISLRRPGGWLTVLGPEIMNGVSVAVWEAALADLRRQNKDLQNLVKPVVHHAIAYAKMGDEATRKRLTILYRPMSAEDFVRARARMRIGVRYRDEDSRAPQAQPDLFAGALPTGNAAPKAADASPDIPAGDAKPRPKAKRKSANRPATNGRTAPRAPQKTRNWTFRGR
jgi:hypothetical protein